MQLYILQLSAIAWVCMILNIAYLCTWCQSPVVVLGSVWSIRSWGPGDELLSPESAAHAHLSSRGRGSQTARVSAPCSRNAACSRLWNSRIPRSRCDAVTLLTARPVVMVMMMMMGCPLHLLCDAATAPEPESAELLGGTSPFLLHSKLTVTVVKVKENYRSFTVRHCLDHTCTFQFSNCLIILTGSDILKKWTTE